MSKPRRFTLLMCSLAVSGILLLQAQDKQGAGKQPQDQQTHEKADSGKFIGSWKMTSLTPDGDTVPWKLVLKQQDGKLVGTISSDNGEADLKEITVTGAKIHFVSPYEGEDYDEDLELQSNKLVGTWSGNGASGKTTGERAAGS